LNEELPIDAPSNASNMSDHREANFRAISGEECVLVDEEYI
jgi:hypothetical protein